MHCIVEMNQATATACSDTTLQWIQICPELGAVQSVWIHYAIALQSTEMKKSWDTYYGLDGSCWMTPQGQIKDYEARPLCNQNWSADKA